MASIGCPRRPLTKILKAALNLEVLGSLAVGMASAFGAASASVTLGPDVLDPGSASVLSR